MSKPKVCDRCGLKVEKFKDLKKVRDERLCKDCYKENRKNHRKESIEMDGAKEELKKIDAKIRRDLYIKKVGAERRPGRPKYTNNEQPKIKGSTKRFEISKPTLGLTRDDKQNLFRILISKGCTGEEAEERIKSLTEEQRRIRKIMKSKDNSEEEIRAKQQEMLEELWRY